jgi:DNA repair ATPase RecN
VTSEGDSHKNLKKSIIRWEGVNMKKERLEWVMSGLNQHVLSKTEDQFIKTAAEDFDKNHDLTEQQEEKLESLYKEKSKRIPNKNLVTSKESPKKTKPRKPHWKAVF